MNSQDLNQENKQNVPCTHQVSGTIGIIACPMLEDELIYNLLSDPDEKCIYVVDTGSQGSLVSKLKYHEMPYQMISEYSFDCGINGLDRSQYNLVIYMNKLGLHAEPKVLKSKLESQVSMHTRLFDAILVYYGICGNYGWDISQTLADEAEIPIIAIRDENGKICDDCIGVAVGGTDNYFRLNKAYTGVLYLTPAMATNWEDFMASSEMARGCDLNDHDMMKMLFEICGYKYALKLDTGIGDREMYEKCAHDICREMNLELIDAEDGWTTLEPINRAYAEAKSSLKPSGA